MEQSDFPQAVAALLEATRPGAEDVAAALVAQQRLTELAPGLATPTLNLGLGQLSEALAEPRTEYPALLALACLALVEEGANPRIPLDPVLGKVKCALAKSRNFIGACRRAARQAGQDLSDEECLEHFGAELARQRAEEGWAWRGLPDLCQCAAALLNQTPQAVPRMRANAALVPECQRLIDDFPDLLPPPVHELHAMLRALSDWRAASNALLDPAAPGALAVAGCKFFEAEGARLPVSARDAVLPRLAEGLRDPRLIFPALLTRCAEVLVEAGGDAEVVFEPFLDRVAVVLDQAHRFVLACRDEAAQVGEEELDDEDCIEQAADLVRRRLPIESLAWTGLASMCQSLVTLVAASPEARRRVRGHRALMRGLTRLAGVQESSELLYVRFLQAVLRVLDGADLLVLHPAQQRGYRVRFGGVFNICQLSTLLAGALLSDPAAGWLEGEPLDKEVVALARDRAMDRDAPRLPARFDLVGWPGYLSDGSFDLKSTLFHTDLPADIPLFEGQRVVLLREPWMRQQWNPNRAVERLHAWLTVEGQLSAAEVDAWLTLLRNAERPED